MGRKERRFEVIRMMLAEVKRERGSVLRWRGEPEST